MKGIFYETSEEKGKPVQIWLISDTHFGHDNMYKFTYDKPDGTQERVRGRFQSAQEGDEYMVQMWNQLVGVEDHVWHLGDVAMGHPQNLQIVKRLNGHKRLILGNHDREKMPVYMGVGFQKIMGARFLDGLLLTHYPVHPVSISWKVKANVHGHIHQNAPPSGKYINVSVERIDYQPVPLETVQEWAKKLESFPT